MKLRVFGQARDIGSVFLWSAVLGLLGTAASQAAFKADLQGQHAGGTNWVNGPLQGWKELQFIPARALFTGGPATNQVITVRFDHTRSSGTTRGIENVTGFTPSSNVLITAGPTLSAPAGDDIWSYTFTITITNAADGFVEFRARLAAGAHLFPGSSLNLSLPGPGQLQIFKPAAEPGNPDLAIAKSGPSQAKPGETITYAINYTNKASAATTAIGVQVTDVLPSAVTYVPGTATKGGTAVGNTLTWDLGNLNPGRRGWVTYKVTVSTNIAFTQTFANFAQILSSHDDANPGDNSASVTTTVVVIPTPVANDDSYGVPRNGTLIVPAPGVLINDFDAATNPLTAILFSIPENGMLAFNSDGSFTYTPDTNFVGIDDFAYRATNGTNTSGPAVVTISVTNPCDFVVSTNITVSNDPGQCGAIVNYPPPTPIGTCAAINCEPTNGSFFPVGTTTVTCTNADGVSRSFLVTVLDSEPPAIVCQDLVLSTDAGQCSRSNVSYALTATDNCSTNVTVVCNPPAGSTFARGTNTVTCTATDATGNTNTCSFTVTILDTEPPTISCPDSVVVSASPGQSSAFVSFAPPVVDDNCPDAGATCSPPSSSVFPVGTTTVTCLATDTAGNTNACTFTVTVNPTPITNLVAEFATSPMVLNRQTGLFEQSVRLSNLGETAVTNARVYVLGLPSTNSLYNRSGVATPMGWTNVAPFVQYGLPLAPGSNVVLLLEFYLPALRPVTNHMLLAEEGQPIPPPTVPPGAQSVPLQPGRNPLQLSSGRFLIEWASLPGRTYLIQYRSDLNNTNNWKTVVPTLVATATAVQWIDDGPPKTETPPNQASSRFYRVFLLPAN